MKRIFKRSTKLSVENITNALREVHDPRSGQDVIGADLVSGVALQEDGRVSFVITVALEDKHYGLQLQEACRKAVEALDGVTNVTAALTAESAPKPDAPPRARATWNLTPVEGVQRIIAIASGKGGVGKSTTTVQLARALAKTGSRVGILDADIYGPSIPRMMGLSGQPELEENRFIPLETDGIRCISMGFLISDKAAVMRGPMVTKALVQMLRHTQWGTEAEPLDILLVDLPPGTGDVHLSMVQQVPLAHNGGGAILVTTPQEVALDDARKAAEMFAKVDVPVLGIIENMSGFTDESGHTYHLFGQGGGKTLASELGAPLLGHVPIIPEMGQAADKGDAYTADIFVEIAGKLAS